MTNYLTPQEIAEAAAVASDTEIAEALEWLRDIGYCNRHTPTRAVVVALVDDLYDGGWATLLDSVAADERAHREAQRERLFELEAEMSAAETEVAKWQEAVDEARFHTQSYPAGSHLRRQALAEWVGCRNTLAQAWKSLEDLDREMIEIASSIKL